MNISNTKGDSYMPCIAMAHSTKWMISSYMMHDTPLTCNHHQSVTYISAYNPLINAVVDYSKLHWSFYLIISAYLFKIVCSTPNHCGQLVLAINGCQGAQ